MRVMYIFSLFSHQVYTTALTHDSPVPGNFIVWSSPPTPDPIVASFSSIFTIEGEVKRSAFSQVLQRESGPSVPNVVASGEVD